MSDLPALVWGIVFVETNGPEVSVNLDIEAMQTESGVTDHAAQPAELSAPASAATQRARVSAT